MRIDLLTTELRDGGAERCLTHLALGLQHEHDVRVISIGPLPKSGPRTKLLGLMRAADLHIESLECPTITSFAQAYWRLKRLWRISPPHLVQSFLFHANVLGASLALQCGIPVLVGGMRVTEHRRYRRWLERQAVQKMQGIVCVSDSVAQFTRHYLSPKPSCFVNTIPNGVDAERFSGSTPIDWSQFGLTGSGPVVLVLGRLNPQKGVNEMLQMAGPMLDRCPQARLAVVGEGPLSGAVRKVFKNFPEGRAVLVPWSENVPGLLAASRVLWLTSRFEGMPNVVLEAMSAGLPVVATEVEGVRELLGEADNGQIVSLNDFSTTMASLERFLNSSQISSQIGMMNQLRVKEKFSVPAMLGAYRKFYDGLSGLHGFAPKTRA